MTIDSSTLEKIPDNKPVRVFLPMKGKVDKYRSSCIFRQTTPPEFNLLFKPGTLPEELIDTKGTCLISIDMGGPNLSLQAIIKKVENDQTLNMALQKKISYEQMREFFRVDASASVISSSFHPEFYGDDAKPWSVKGQTIDISGSGILASFSEKVPMDKQVRLAITLPSEEPEIIHLLARPVRVQQLAENHFEIAYHFDEISTEDRDKIIGCCLEIQRKLLRLKVRVRDLNNL